MINQPHTPTQPVRPPPPRAPESDRRGLPSAELNEEEAKAAQNEFAEYLMDRSAAESMPTIADEQRARSDEFAGLADWNENEEEREIDPETGQPVQEQVAGVHKHGLDLSSGEKPPADKPKLREPYDSEKPPAPKPGEPGHPAQQPAQPRPGGPGENRTNEPRPGEPHRR